MNTTTVKIPRNEKADQRVIFSDDFLFMNHRLIRVFPRQIMNILPLTGEGGMYSIVEMGLDKLYDNLWRKVEKIISADGKEFASGNDKRSAKRHKLDDIAKECYVLHIRADGLDDRYLISISSETLKRLTRHIWGDDNHKEI